jgi:hypothetical protein
MIRRPCLAGVFLAAFLAAFFSCQSSSRSVIEGEEPEFMKNFSTYQTDFPADFSFVPEGLPDLEIPPDVGTASDFPSADDPLRAAFAVAYQDGVLRGLPLSGVLGGDRVHFWPGNNPQSRIQNWIGGDSRPNSWGIPGLVLAVGSAESAADSYAVYAVSGAILDKYGRSPAPNTGNGAAGYGYPLSGAVYSDGAAVQYFSRGTIRAGKDGVVFIPGTSGIAGEVAPENSESIPPEITKAFAAAAFLPAREFAQSDGPLFRIVLTEPWIAEGAAPITISGAYIKSFDEGKSILVLPDSPDLPLRARYVSGPFLSALLLSGRRIRGAEDEKASGNAGVRGAYLKALFDGFAVYGFPLTDALPVETKNADAGNVGAAESGGFAPYQEAQRFTKGWIIAPPLPLPAPQTEPEETLPEDSAELEAGSVPPDPTETDTAAQE